MPSAWVKPGRFSNNRGQEPRLGDLIPLKKFKPGVFYELRAIGAPFTYAEHWFDVEKKDGSGTYPRRKLCLGYDDATGEFTGKCPYCEILGSPGKVATLQNFIDRKLERGMPRDLPPLLKGEKKLQQIINDSDNEWFLKEKDSESWTPVEPVRLPSSPCQDIANMVGSNTRANRDGEHVPMPPEHPKYGFDIKLKFDPNATPAKQYFIEKSGPSKLGQEELDYLIYKLDVEVPETYAEAKKNAEYFADKIVEKTTESEGEKPRVGKSESRGAGRGALADLDGDPDSFDPEDVDAEAKPARRTRREEPEEEEEEERPVRRATIRRRDPEEEEERPARRTAIRRSDPEEEEAKPARRTASRRDEPEDEPMPRRRPTKRDEPEDDDDRPAPRRAKPKPASRQVNDDIEDQEDGGDLDL